MNVLLLATLSAMTLTGMSADEYYRRSFHVAEPEKRIELLNRALEANPNYTPALRSRAIIHSMLDRKKEAFADAAKAAELEPGDAEANFTAGVFAEDVNEHGRAAEFYARSLARDEKNAACRTRLIEALLKVRQFDEALKHADWLVERRPQDDFPHLLRSEVYEWFDRYTDAVRDVTVVIDRHPDDANFAQNYLRRCINLRCLGEGQKALADAEKAMQFQGGRAYVHAARGCSYEALGQLDKAIEDYQKAAEMDEDKRYFTIWSCLAYRKLGKRAEADKLVKEYLKGFKDDKWIAPVLRHLAGEMKEDEVFKLAHDEDAEKTRQQLCEAYYYIGACHLAEGDLDKAEELFKKCLEQRVNNFYEHGFAIRDLRTVKALREKKPGGTGEPKHGEGGPR